MLLFRDNAPESIEPEIPGGWDWHQSNNNHHSDHHYHTGHASHLHSHEHVHRPYSGRYYPRNPSYRLSRDELREFASVTLETLDAGFYYPPGKDSPYDLTSKIEYTNEQTGFYASDDAVLSNWAEADLGLGTSKAEDGVAEKNMKTKIIIGEYSTLVGARKLHSMVSSDKESASKIIGVLNFASAKKPGGGFINGAQAQEESIARSSTLFPSLTTPTASQFYRYYADDPDNAYYTHAMVYSPSVVLIRSDRGDWKYPIDVDVLTSAAVNAGDVRKQVEWEEEMRLLRERVKAAEIERKREQDRIRREEDEERKKLEEEERAEEEEERKKAEAQKKKEDEDARESDKPSDIPDNVDEGQAVADGAGIASEVVDAALISNADQTPNESSPEPITEPSTTYNDHATSPIASPITFATDPDPTPRTQISTFSLDASESEPIDAALHSHPRIEIMDNPFELAELQIASEMYERIARLLLLFHQRGARHLVLGSFGTGVFKNSIELVAGIFKELLCGDDDVDCAVDGGRGRIGTADKGKFKGAFDTVMFAILGGATVRSFQKVFEGAEGMAIDEEGEPGSDIEDMKDAADVHAQDGKTENKTELTVSEKTEAYTPDLDVEKFKELDTRAQSEGEVDPASVDKEYHRVGEELKPLEDNNNAQTQQDDTKEPDLELTPSPIPGVQDTTAEDILPKPSPI